MQAAILSIGDELALGQNLDTNSAWLAAQLAERSIITVEHRTVADDRHAIAVAIEQLLLSGDVLIITGGLGPTADDLTRESLGDAITPGQELVVDQDALEHLALWFSRRGRSMPTMNNKQALRPTTMRCLPNPNGTAPGLAGEITHATAGKRFVFSLPGPPNEMKPMFHDHVLPGLPQSERDEVVLSAMVPEFGMGESVAAEKLGSLMERGRNPLVGTTASDSIVTARVRATGPLEATQSALQQTVTTIERAWQPYAFGRGSHSLPETVAMLLREAHQKLAVAESCTGGWLGKSIVDLPKSSDIFLGGWITYSNELKNTELGVPPELIAKHGAVSHEAAYAMALGALRRSAADYSLAITGIAGPDGGMPGKPVGTVFIALGHRHQDVYSISSRHFVFTGDRTIVRDRAVKSALQMLRFALLKVPQQTPLLWEVGVP